jgi:DNA-directed RNA polymerase specialized sigma24 family protein
MPRIDKFVGWNVGSKPSADPDRSSKPCIDKLKICCSRLVACSIDTRMGPVSPRQVGVEADRGFISFYDAERVSAVKLAWLLTHDAAAAEDIAQDAFASVYPRFDNLERPGAYLRTAVVHGVYQRSRRTRDENRRLTLVQGGSASTVDGPTGGLIDAVARLPMSQRTAVVLRYWADLSDADIAAVLDVRRGTVRSLLSRAMAHLRREIPA